MLVSGFTEKINDLNLLLQYINLLVRKNFKLQKPKVFDGKIIVYCYTLRTYHYKDMDVALIEVSVSTKSKRKDAVHGQFVFSIKHVGLDDTCVLILVQKEDEAKMEQ